MKVLVTGGLGYIGSHTVVELIHAGHDVVIVDNLYNSYLNVLDHIETITNVKPPFYELDVTDEKNMDHVFQKHVFDAIIHFAGFKAVGESVRKPLDYYYNNVLSTLILSKLAKKYDVKKFVFSSSATVYGDQESPFLESMPLLETTNPYGETKKMSERILSDFGKIETDKTITLLRYFNPIGAHDSTLIGEVPRGIPNNLMPYITQVAAGKREKLFVYGNDYDTPDGTGVRDYIHVVDLAKGHVLALNHDIKGVHVFNLGTGVGTSVMQMIHAFEKANQIKIPFEIVSRRPGDIATSYANVQKAYDVLGFKTSKTVNDMVFDSWNFEKSIKK